MIRFMNKADTGKYQLFEYLLLKDSTSSTEELAEFLSLSTRTVNRYFSNLKNDCFQIFSAKELQLERESGIISVSVDPLLSQGYFLDRLRLLYLEDSLEFQVINAVYTRRYNSASQLANDLHISLSNLYRLLHKIDFILEKFDLDFTVLHTRADINFHSEEKKLRLFIYFFYWMIFKGLKSPLTPNSMIESKVSQKAMAPFQAFLQSKKSQIDYIVSLTYDRSIESQQYIIMEPETQQTLIAFSSIHDLSLIFSPFCSISNDNHQLSERLFFNFFLRITVSTVDSQEQKKEIVHLLSSLRSPAVLFARDLLSQMSTQFDSVFSEEMYTYFFYYSVLLFLFIDYIDIELPDDFKGVKDLTIFNQSLDESSPTVLQQANAFYQAFRVTHDIPDTYDNTVIALICLMIDCQPKETVSIAIQYSKSVLGETVIKEKLAYIFNPESITFTDNQSLADIIISDCYPPKSYDKEFFYFDTITDPIRWEKLFSYIKKKLANNLFTQNIIS